MRSVIQSVKAARQVSTPLLAIATPDQVATRRFIAQEVGKDNDARVTWDAVKGFTGMNETGKAWVKGLGEAATETELSGVMLTLENLPHDGKRGGIAFLMNAQAWVKDPVFATGVINLRDAYKNTMRTLIMLGPAFTLPDELKHDVVLLDEPMPDLAVLRQVTLKMFSDAGLAKPDEKTEQQVVDAVRGLSAFEAEQVVAMSLSPKGIDISQAWDRKRMQIGQTRGLTMLVARTTLADMGGNERAIEHIEEIFDGDNPPTCVVWIDELEKAMAGFGSDGGPGDNTGITQDQIGEVLKQMENWTDEHNGPGGMILAGPAGSGKSFFARSVAATYGVPLISLDLGALKDSLVGSSEQLIRQGLKVIESVSGGRPLIIATCNKLKVVPTELKRRFTSGLWYFDLPSRAERKAIWAINLKRYPSLALRIEAKDPLLVDAEGNVILPKDDHWTGAEIRNTCQACANIRVKGDDGKKRRATLTEAARSIVPVYKSDAAGIEALRSIADGNFLSASYEGPYDKSKDPEQQLELTGSGSRRFGFDESFTGDEPLAMAVIIGVPGKGVKTPAPKPEKDPKKLN